MDPNWRHIIPPMQDKVISEGHCTEDCTKNSFPSTGISVFAVLMRTRNIGRETKLRQVNNTHKIIKTTIFSPTRRYCILYINTGVERKKCETYLIFMQTFNYFCL